MTVDVTQTVAGDPPVTVTVTGLPRTEYGTVTGIVQRSTDGGIRWTTVRGLAEATIEPVEIDQIVDTFDRTESGEWGEANTGQEWDTSDAGANADVAGGVATVAHPTAATAYDAWVQGTDIADVDVAVSVATNLGSTPAGAFVGAQVLARGSGGDDYRAGLTIQTDGSVSLDIDWHADGVSVSTDLVYTGVETYRLRMRVWGHRIQAKVWDIAGDEPDWQLEAVVPAGVRLMSGAIGVSTSRAVANTDDGLVWSVADFEATVLQDALPVVDDWEIRPDVENRYRAGINQIVDTFARSESGEWGETDTGQTWDTSGLPVAGDADVAGGAGKLVLSSTSQYLPALASPTDIGDIDVSVSAQILASDITGGYVAFGIASRIVGAMSYLVNTRVSTSESMQLRIVGGTSGLLASTALPITHTSSQVYRTRVQVRGHRIRAKVWVPAAAPEPDWQLEAVVPVVGRTASGPVGLFADREAANTNNNLPVYFSDFVADIGQPQWIGGTDSITPTLTRPWLCSVMRSFLNRSITIRSYGEPSRQARGGLTQVHARTLPVGLAEVAGSREWTLELRAADLAEARALEWLVASGDVMWLLVPAGSQVPGGYYRVGQLTGAHHRQQGATRWLTLPLTEVAAPGPDIVTAQSTWDSVIGQYGTWDDVVAVVPSWEALLDLIGDPAEVVVDQ